MVNTVIVDTHRPGGIFLCRNGVPGWVGWLDVVWVEIKVGIVATLVPALW